MTLEIGRVCRKIAGSEAGKLCVVIKNFPKEKGKSGSFVLITGPKILTGVRRKRCNIMHLEPLEYVLDIKEDASDEEVISAYEKANLIKKFGLKKPSAAQLKEFLVKKEEKKIEEEKSKKDEKKTQKRNKK
ncbi:MAG: 50S ribosomal protein L14e [Candidatus Aenigmatarchaeota archaeon]